MGIILGLAAAPFKAVKAVGNRYRVVYHENKIDDMIAPESGVSGFIADKAEDAANFLTFGAVAHIKDGISTKGYSKLDGKSIDSALAAQYSDNITAAAKKKSDAQSKKWSKLEKKMDKLSKNDSFIETMKSRAASASGLVSNTSQPSDACEAGI